MAEAVLQSKRIHAAVDEDPYEFFFERGVTDGASTVGK